MSSARAVEGRLRMPHSECYPAFLVKSTQQESAQVDETDAVSVAPPSDDRFLTAPEGHRLSIFHKWYLTGVSRRLAQ